MKFKGMISGKIGGAVYLSLIEESELEIIVQWGLRQNRGVQPPIENFTN
jgi:hypothetical protein